MYDDIIIYELIWTAELEIGNTYICISRRKYWISHTRCFHLLVRFAECWMSNSILGETRELAIVRTRRLWPGIASAVLVTTERVSTATVPNTLRSRVENLFWKEQCKILAIIFYLFLQSLEIVRNTIPTIMSGKRYSVWLRSRLISTVLETSADELKRFIGRKRNIYPRSGPSEVATSFVA